MKWNHVTPGSMGRKRNESLPIHVRFNLTHPNPSTNNVADSPYLVRPSVGTNPVPPYSSPHLIFLYPRNAMQYTQNVQNQLFSLFFPQKRKKTHFSFLFLFYFTFLLNKLKRGRKKIITLDKLLEESE